MDLLKQQYLGKKDGKKKVVKASEKFSKMFQFDWDNEDDTSVEYNPLYKNRNEANLMFGRGYRAGQDLRDQRQRNSFVEKLAKKRQNEQEQHDLMNEHLTKDELNSRKEERLMSLQQMKMDKQVKMQILLDSEKSSTTHWSDKTLSDMNERDWRIFREDFDIRVQGGRATHPIRKWKEASCIPSSVLQAVEEMGFERPSPIQMQAIPIGLQGRDIIGIAETGSGKTAGFVIPLISYLCELDVKRVDNVADQGPLALVMAPTRELALQIEQEAIKLCKYTKIGTNEVSIKTLSVVGGQSIETQGFALREGIHIVIGTPGRLLDCLESRYLVLNQCNYIVLDEADRMIDMGFEPQVIQVLDSMGAALKSEKEDELEHQLQNKQNYRVTTMFSATMPAEVERLAKTYLRHPVLVKIGDQDSGKNKRIEQRVIFINPMKKQAKLADTLRTTMETKNAKVIVFINLKKQCDGVSKFVQKQGYYPTVLHGGKSQDQRQESLRRFREGHFNVLVATDVAGRGLDIPDVTHVINYDVPSRIDNYCHRIGRTGRAGKNGIAISFVTDDDKDIMYDLKQYLISTDAEIPSEILKHPSAKAAYGTRDERGHLLASKKRESVQYLK